MESAWTETEVAYFAGVIDGEGCFCLHNPGTHRLSCQLHIGNTNLLLLDWVRVHFGGSVHRERRPNMKHKTVWRWYAHAKDMDRIIAAVLPFLIVKRQQAELILAYRATLRRARGGQMRLYRTPNAVKEQRADIHARLAVLNARGVA